MRPLIRNCTSHITRHANTPFINNRFSFRPYSQSSNHRNSSAAPRILNNPYFRQQINRDQQKVKKQPFMNDQNFLVINPLFTGKKLNDEKVFEFRLKKDEISLREQRWKNKDSKYTERPSSLSLNKIIKRYHQSTKRKQRDFLKIYIKDCPLNVMRISINNVSKDQCIISSSLA